MHIEPTFLADLIAAALNAGATAKVTDSIMESRRLAQLSPRARRYASLATASALASTLYLLYCAMIATWPASARAWANDLAAVSFLAVTASQALHGAKNLPTTPKPHPVPTQTT